MRQQVHHTHVRSVTAKEKQFGNKVRSAFLHVGLIVSCITYITVGAYVFLQIERPLEIQKRNEALIKFEQLKQDFLSNITEKPDNFDILMDDYTKNMMEMFEDPISAHAYESLMGNETEVEDLWTFPSSLLFTSTTVIPVGYGYITPASTAGRCLVVLYGMVGIPLALVTMADAGKFISQFVTRWFDESLTIPTVLFLSMLTLYPVVGGLLFHLLADMQFLDAIYFSLTSIFTIGFGDLTPQVNIVYLVVFNIFGVILVTITIDFAAAEIINHIHYVGRNMGRARELAGKMFQIAQSLNVNKGISVGMTQLHALARFGMMGKMEHRPSHPLIKIAFEPDLDDETIDYMDGGIPSEAKGSRLFLNPPV